MPLNRTHLQEPRQDGDTTEAVRVPVGDPDDKDLMVDIKTEPTPVTSNEKTTNPNWKAGSGKRKQKVDLFEKTKRRIRMKTIRPIA